MPQDKAVLHVIETDNVAMAIELDASGILRKAKLGKRNGTLLHFACASGAINIVKWLLSQATTDINSTESSAGRTPFIHAIEKGQIEIVKLLMVQPQLDHNKPDANGNSPLTVASCKINANLVRWIIYLGKDLVFSPVKGRASIDFADAFADLDFMNMLIYFINSPKKAKEVATEALRKKNQLPLPDMEPLIYVKSEKQK